MSILAGKSALVTGGSRGMGRAISLALARAGADLAVNYASSRSSAEDLCAEIRSMGRRAVALRADLSEPESARGLAREAMDALGGISILVSNAGVGDIRAIDQVDESTWDRTHNLNLKAAFLLSQAVVPGMRAAKWGRLIYIASTAAQTGGIVGPHYASSKAGLIGLAHSYASLLAREGITANAIAMALVETDMLKAAPNVKPGVVPVGRFGEPDEIARAAVLLAETGYITGQTININGGVYFS
ncbi:MAG: SDR family NAD(P)-dependent oxidoreductase [Burkholderiales bacterium]|nr:SDR family NAD(P)-dependent oxidoreductase [Burkholderiales bacterium]